MRIDEDGVIRSDEDDYIGGLQPAQQDVFGVAPAAPATTNVVPNANNAQDVLDAFQKIASVGQTIQNVGSAANTASAATRLAGAADAGTNLFGFDPASLLVSALTRLMFNRKAPSYLDLNPAVPVTPEMNAQSLYDLLQSTEAQPSEFGDTEGRDARYMALFEEASRLGLDDITNDLLQNPYISSMQAASGDTLPEGFVRDREGNVRDATTGGYYSIVNGKPFPRTAPFFPVPMPDLSDAAGGSATASATNATPASTADQIREYANREGVTAADVAIQMDAANISVQQVADALGLPVDVVQAQYDEAKAANAAAAAAAAGGTTGGVTGTGVSGNESLGTGVGMMPDPNAPRNPDGTRPFIPEATGPITPKTPQEQWQDILNDPTVDVAGAVAAAELIFVTLQRV